MLATPDAVTDRLFVENGNSGSGYCYVGCAVFSGNRCRGILQYRDRTTVFLMISMGMCERRHRPKADNQT